jgi:hypothetical protein
LIRTADAGDRVAAVSDGIVHAEREAGLLLQMSASAFCGSIGREIEMMDMRGISRARLKETRDSMHLHAFAKDRQTNDKRCVFSVLVCSPLTAQLGRSDHLL